MIDYLTFTGMYDFVLSSTYSSMYCTSCLVPWCLVAARFIAESGSFIPASDLWRYIWRLMYVDCTID